MKGALQRLGIERGCGVGLVNLGRNSGVGVGITPSRIFPTSYAIITTKTGDSLGGISRG